MKGRAKEERQKWKEDTRDNKRKGKDEGRWREGKGRNFHPLVQFPNIRDSQDSAKLKPIGQNSLWESHLSCRVLSCHLLTPVYASAVSWNWEQIQDANSDTNPVRFEYPKS